MAAIIHPGRWGQRKPSLGAQIDFGHPLAQGLIGAWLINEGGGKVIHDLSGGGNHLAVTGDASFSQGYSVAGLRGPNSGLFSGAIIAAPTDRLKPTVAVSVFWRGAIHSDGNRANNPPFFSQFYAASYLDSPFVSYSIGRRSTDADKLSVFHSGGGGSRIIDITGGIVTADYGKAVSYGFSRQPGSTLVYRGSLLIGGDSEAGNLAHGIGGVATVNRHNGVDGNTADTTSDVIWVWNQALTSDQFAWLASEPYAFVKGPAPRRIWFATGTSTSISSTGIASTESLGTPRLDVAGSITSTGGIESTATVGTPWLLEISGVGGIASPALVGSPVVTQPVAISEAGAIASTARVGTATLLPVTTRAFTVFIGGVDRTKYIKDPTISISMQLGSRASCSFRIIPEIAGNVVLSSFIPTLHDEVIIHHNTSGLRLFAGEVESTEYTLHNGRSDYFTLEVRCTDYGVLCDRRAMAKLYTIAIGSYVPIIARDIVDNFLDGTGITYDGIIPPTGSYLGEQLINWLTVTEAFDHICDPAGLVWMITKYKELKLIDRAVGTGAAPFAIVQNNGFWRSMTSAQTRGKFANRVIVRNFGTAPYWTDTVQADGSSSYLTTYAQEVVPTVNLNGTAQIVCEAGQRGSTLGWQWYFIQDGIGLFPNPLTAPSSGEITITYPSVVSPVAIAEDAASIAAVGRYDHIEETTDQAGDAEMQTYAESLLAILSTIPRVLDIETDKPGLEPGQLLTVNANGVSGDFLVEQVDISEVYNSYPRWNVRASNASQRNGSGTQFFKRLIRRTRQGVLPGESRGASTTGTRVNGPAPGFGPHGSIVAPIAITASSYHSFYDAERAFNGGSVSDGFGVYYWAGTGGGVDWIRIDFGASASNALTSYNIQSTNVVSSAAAPKDWKMEGSTDGATWTVLDTRTNEVLWAAGEVRNFLCSGSGSYRYFRLNITANNGDPTYTHISELYLY